MHTHVRLTRRVCDTRAHAREYAAFASELRPLPAEALKTPVYFARFGPLPWKQQCEQWHGEQRHGMGMSHSL